ncbi:sulfurtransferase [Thalassobaculum fulvum]|uniref:Sulfurtransferase n=1 Tax=Thalassobaculum fulvum TaxID=1633335 RepID=A0A918XSF7_9PROT|nr:3-mercaptopyruvate sulfurtransferase [Thalassobaculum fulvum]GHD48363.1 sulfurtransferase [Thalassobaculum fulvum]
MSDPVAGGVVSTAWLADRLNDPTVKVLDGTYHLPTAKRDGNAEFLERHIPGAVRFDIDDVCDPDDPLPHMIPSPDRFAEKVSALGIGNGDTVVVYDVYGLQSAARTWWMFRLFGHDKVAVLDGGMPAWTAEGRALESGPAKVAPARFTAGFRPELVRRREDVLANIASKAEQVADARSAGRFTGTEPEPRAGMRSGHIPGSRSLPISELLDPATKTVLPNEGLRAAFDKAGLDPSKPIVSSCGSGVTACVIALAAHRLGHPGVAVYDGSWSEWGGRDDTPVETGPAA